MTYAEINKPLGNEPAILTHIPVCAGHTHIEVAVAINRLERTLPVSGLSAGSDVKYQLDVWRHDEDDPRGLEKECHGRISEPYYQLDHVISLGSTFHGPLDPRAWKIDHPGGEHVADLMIKSYRLFTPEASQTESTPEAQAA